MANKATTDGHRIAVAFIALVFGAIAMGASPIFVRVADVGPYASAFWRAALALPFLWCWARFERAGQLQLRFCLDRAVLLAGLCFAVDLFFWHLAITSTSVANAAFFATTSPIWVAVGARLVLVETINRQILWGLALCVLGGATLVVQSYSFAQERLQGDFFGIATALCFGCYVLAVRAARGRMSAARLSLLSTTITAAILFGVAAVLEPFLLPRSIEGAAAVLALALVSQIGGQGLLAIALGTLPATFSSLVCFLEAVAAAGFGWMFLGEALSATQGVGGALILLGIFVARPRNNSKQESN